MFALHGAGGFALGGMLVWKSRRVWRRLVRPWDRRTAAGAGAAAFVAVSLLSGWAWSSGVQLSLAGYNLLNWHFALGTALTLVVLGHALLRAKPLRRADLAGRRQFLRVGAVALGAYAAWWMQRPVGELLELRGAKRRFTGSYERSSFTGNDFPTTSWVADKPRVLDPGEWRLEVAGLVERPLELTRDELDAGDELVATLDCTGGFYSRQRWRGIALERLLSRARPLGTATHVRVISHTGYRWGFALGELEDLLLATHVGWRGAVTRPRRAAAPRRTRSARVPVGEVGRADRAARRAGSRSGGVHGLEQLHRRGPRSRVRRPSQGSRGGGPPSDRLRAANAGWNPRLRRLQWLAR